MNTNRGGCTPLLVVADVAFLASSIVVGIDFVSTVDVVVVVDDVAVSIVLLDGMIVVPSVVVVLFFGSGGSIDDGDAIVEQAKVDG
jgi:hypothetical protein